MDHQPGHFFRRPGVEEDVAHEPVSQEESEARRAHKAYNQTRQPKDNTYLLIQGNEHQVVIPGLPTTRYLLLLYPVVQSLPYTITDATANIREDNGEQHQKNSPTRQDSEEPVCPRHGQDSIKHALPLRIDPGRQPTPTCWRQFAEH